MFHWSTQAWMWPLLLVMAAGAVVYTTRVYARTLPDPGPRLRPLLIALRGCAVGALVLAVGGPFLVLMKNIREIPELVVVVEDSESMDIRDGARGAPGDSVSRWQRALEVCRDLQDPEGRMAGLLRPVFLRGNGLEGVREFDPGAAVAPPSALGTDLEALLAGALRQRRGHPVGAVLLVSDGNEAHGPSSAGPGGEVVGSLHDLPAGSVFAVLGVGDVRGPEDRLIADVRCPPVVHPGDEVQVDITVEQRFHRPASGDSLTITLRDEKGELDSTRIPDRAGPLTASLVYRPRGEGPQLLTVGVSPLVNERFRGNNETTLAVTVARRRARLLLLSLAPGWDGRFFAQAALGEPRLELEVAYRSERGLVLADSLVPWTPPVDAQGWRGYDAVILQFAAAGDFGDPAQWSGLVRAVDDGLGLLLLPGPGFPRRSGFPRLPASLSGILPVTPDGQRWRPGEFALVPSALGHPVLAGVGSIRSGGRNGGLELLPPVRGILPVTVKDTGRVVLEGRARQGGTMPLLVLGPAGKGRVAWYGGDALWRAGLWPLAAGKEDSGARNHPGRRLLTNLLVWLGTGETAGGLRLLDVPPLASSGRPLLLAGVWQDLRGDPVTVGDVVLVITDRDRQDAPPRTFAAEVADPVTGRFTVRISPLPPGDYDLQLQGRGPVSATGRRVPLAVRDVNMESRQLRQDRRRLRQLAATAGGVYFDAGADSSLAVLEAMLGTGDQPPRERVRRLRLDVTRGLPFLGLVVLLLALEWYLRRRHGLL